MNNDKTNVKTPSPIPKTKVKKQQKKIRNYVYKIIIDVVGAALERPVA